MNLKLIFAPPDNWQGAETELSRIIQWDFPGLRYTCALLPNGTYEVVIGAGPWQGQVVAEIERLGFRLLPSD